jgi:DNA-binding GntR family transcriptional regulator
VTKPSGRGIPSPIVRGRQRTEDGDFVLALQRTTTAEQIAHQMRDLILAGEVAPGSRIVESVLAPTFEVSRNTLREALRLLTREGLVSHKPHRGFVVTLLTDRDIRELYHVRRIVERAAVDAACGVARTVSELKDALDELQLAVRAADPVKALELDLDFHRTLVRALQSPRIDAFFAEVLLALRLGLLALDRSEGTAAILRDHRKLVQALRGGDRTKAQALLTAHLDDAEARLQRMFAAQ